jgi:hypothetical protein
VTAVVRCLVLALCGWAIVRLGNIPIDVLLICVVVLSASRRRSWLRLGGVLLLGWWGESAMLLPSGTLLVPYLVVFVFVQGLHAQLAGQQPVVMSVVFAMALFIGLALEGLLYQHAIILSWRMGATIIIGMIVVPWCSQWITGPRSIRSMGWS